LPIHPARRQQAKTPTLLNLPIVHYITTPALQKHARAPKTKQNSSSATAAAAAAGIP
jgi:hypothetical protein